jgi:cell division septation protein DedD
VEPTREATRKPETIAPNGNPDTTLLDDLNGAEPPPEIAPSRRPPAATSAPAASEGGFVIQVFSSPDDDQARKVLDRLTSGGFAAFISPVDVEGRVMHRVRVGPFSDRNEADSVAARVSSAYRLDTWVTPND